jgi:hypothetical protein
VLASRATGRLECPVKMASAKCKRWQRYQQEYYNRKGGCQHMLTCQDA